MSKLQELIKELCPEGVEFRKLGEVCEIFSGKNKQKNDDGEYPVYGSTGIIAYCDNYKYSKEQLLIARVGANAGFTHIANGKYDVSDNTLIVDVVGGSCLKYIYYLLVNLNLNKYSKGGGQPLVTAGEIKVLEIPFPPLEVQNEIVRILDTFTSHAAELQAELQARKEQYEYYRNKLLTFDENDEGVKWMKLGEICDNYDRKRKPVTASNRKPGPYPYYGASGIVDYVESFIFDGDYLLVSEDGANLLARTTPIAFSIKGKNWVNNHAHILKFHDMCTQKYVEYYINMIDVSQYVSGGAQPKLNQENLNKISIPVPPLSEQQHIVSILDKFESLVNDLTTGLPAEIAAVQEQYEYYRNKLLTFERKS